MSQVAASCELLQNPFLASGFRVVQCLPQSDLISLQNYCCPSDVDAAWYHGLEKFSDLISGLHDYTKLFYHILNADRPFPKISNLLLKNKKQTSGLEI